MEFTKEQVANILNDLEQQEKMAWGELNKILGAKAVYEDMWNKMEEEGNTKDLSPEKG